MKVEDVAAEDVLVLRDRTLAKWEGEAKAELAARVEPAILVALSELDI